MLRSLTRACRGLCSSNGQRVTTEVFDETVFAICINRPEKRNAVDWETAEQLLRGFGMGRFNPCIGPEEVRTAAEVPTHTRCVVEAFDQFEKDSNLQSAILYGAGGSFCAGYDLSSITPEDLPKLSAMIGTRKRPMGPSHLRLSKPLIASVDGYAVAGGLELALLADMRVMEADAVMGVFCRRFGVPLIDGGTVRLQRIVGFGRAMELVLTGREVKADEAFRIGLANVVCDIGTSLGQSLQLASRLRKFPQKCMLADRRSLYYATFDAQNEAEAFDFELRNAVDILHEESVRGAARFASGVGRGGSFDLDGMKRQWPTKRAVEKEFHKRK